MTEQTLRSSYRAVTNAASTVKVTHLLTQKGDKVWTVTADASVFEAIRIMAEHSVGALPVIEGPRVVGIISERDYARKVILQGKSSKTTLVAEIMTSNLITVTPEATVSECMELMTNLLIRHLPVLREGTLVGIISIGDLVRDIIVRQQFALDELERYVAG